MRRTAPEFTRRICRTHLSPLKLHAKRNCRVANRKKVEPSERNQWPAINALQGHGHSPIPWSA